MLGIPAITITLILLDAGLQIGLIVVALIHHFRLQLPCLVLLSLAFLDSAFLYGKISSQGNSLAVKSRSIRVRIHVFA